MNEIVKEAFDEKACKWQVDNLSTKTLLDYKDGMRLNHRDRVYKRKGVLIETSIYSERTAHLLNYIFNFKRWNAGKWESFDGGGFIADSDTKVKLCKFNEVRIAMEVKCNHLLFEAEYNNVLKPKIFKMIKTAINDYIKYAFTSNNVTVIKEIDDNGFIVEDVTIEQLKVLRDHFDYVTVKDVYSKQLIDQVLGQKNEDVFKMSAVEVLENQIKALIAEQGVKRDEHAEKYMKFKDWILKRYEMSRKKIIDQYELKIKELENQIKELSMNN